MTDFLIIAAHVLGILHGWFWCSVYMRRRAKKMADKITRRAIQEWTKREYGGYKKPN